MATNTYVSLNKQTVSTAVSVVTFDLSSLQNYTDLCLVINGTGSTTSDLNIQFNNDTASNYSRSYLSGNGSAVFYGGTAPAPSIGAINLDTTIGISIVNFKNYSSTTKNKTVIARNNINSTNIVTGMWRSTAAITSITLTTSGGTVSTGSTFSLYGILANSTTAKATGGTITSDASYWYHTFTASGTFTPTQTLSCDMLVVAGGGGGGGAVSGSIGGAGGAGGFQYLTSQTVVPSAQTITVGGGGTRGLSTPTSGSQGSNSVFGSLTASVGGGGGGGSNGLLTGFSGGNGGSGGGAGFSASTTTIACTGTAGQGKNGGPEGSGGGGSGGGGAGSAGTNPSAGSGLANSISGTSVTYATGGSGAGSAGNGVVPADPAVNLGIGGASGWNANGANGGSGIVIVRYAR
jgi:hypothetical protein